MSATTSTTPGDATALVTNLYDPVEKVVVVDSDGEEVEVKVANPGCQPRPRGPKVTFRTHHVDFPYYAKIFLPKTYQNAKLAAIKLFRKHLETSYPYPRTLDFELKATVKTKDGKTWAWASILPEEWWEIMNELIEENPHVEVGVFPLK